MNIETFEYSLLASLLGIIIVFTSLCGLSFLMVLIKVAFGERKKEEDPAVAAPAKQTKPINQDSPLWIMAAAAAFLAHEGGPTASKWTPGAFENTDPWMNRPGFNKN